MEEISRVDCSSARAHVSLLAQLLSKYKWLLDIYVIEFFTENHWSKLPQAWQETLSNASLTDLSCLLLNNPYATVPCNHKRSFSKVYPLSLLAFSSASHSLSLSRHPSSSAIHLGRDEKGKAQLKGLDHLFRCHLKPKKQHEIKLLGEVIHQLSVSVRCKNIIDMGSGKGHLARYLAFNYGLNVTAVEGFGGHLTAAVKYDRDVEKTIVKRCRKQGCEPLSEDSSEVNEPLLLGSGSLKHVEALISPDMSVSELLSKINFHGSVFTSPLSLSTTSVDVNKPSTPSGLTCEANPSSQSVPQAIEKKQLLSDNEISVCNEPGDQVNHFRSHDDVTSCSHLLSNSQIHSKLQVDINSFSKAKTSKNKQMVSSLSTISSFPGQEDHCVLIGLHTCGDLAPTMLRAFTKSKSIVGVVSVGCCYMKLTCPEEINEQRRDKVERLASLDDLSVLGFPMSLFTTSLGCSLSYEAREVACHSLEVYRGRLQGGPESFSHLKVHCHRAAVEILLRKAGLRRSQVRISKRVSKLPFQDYARALLQSISSSHTTPTSLATPTKQATPIDLLSDVELTSLSTLVESHWSRVVTLFMLRLTLAPCVESLILLDRVIFLLEQGATDVRLVPLFDPTLSPRNYVLIAM